MAAKKTTKTKKSAAKQTKTTSKTTRAKAMSAPAYSCDDPPKTPMTLRQLARKLQGGDTKLAAFLANLICRSNGGDTDAQACVEKYFRPSDSELRSLCIPQRDFERLQKCTDQNLLVSAGLYLIAPSGFGKRKK